MGCVIPYSFPSQQGRDEPDSFGWATYCPLDDRKSDTAEEAILRLPISQTYRVRSQISLGQIDRVF
jgi:hypothetical protein